MTTDNEARLYFEVESLVKLFVVLYEQNLDLKYNNQSFIVSNIQQNFRSCVSNFEVIWSEIFVIQKFTGLYVVELRKTWGGIHPTDV